MVKPVSFLATARLNRVDEVFCETVCLEDLDEDDEPLEALKKKCSLATFRERCGLTIAMDVWRKFAAFGRENIRS